GKGSTILTDEGAVLAEVRQARERGVIFDAANGRSHFSMNTARLLYKGCLQRNRKSYTSLTPDLFLVTGFLPDGDASVYPALIF
ncbi:hypothetical protein MJN69_30800, partial [Salmonella enterica subsp. enterica serovar Kentucky]|nr:hypothetical protein [Salmonella enterica subsp. enterica serovar Kentucky]